LNINDLVAGLDPTAFTDITGAQILTAIDDAQPSSDRGFILVTSDNVGVPVIPDAGTNTQWQRYLWLRFSPLTQSFTVNAWNAATLYNMPYSNGTGTTVATYWNPITSGSIPANSISLYQLAVATITSLPYLTINLSQVSGYATLVTTGTALAGAVTGTIGATVIAPGTISGAQLYSDGVNGIVAGNINAKAVTAAKILGGTNGQILQTTDGTTDVGWVTKTIISGLAEPNAGGSNDGQYVVVNSGAAGTYKFVAAPTNYSHDFGALSTIIASSVSNAHALGAIPTFVRAVLRCNAGGGDNGYAQYDEISVDQVFSHHTATSFENYPILAYGANATNVFAAVTSNASNGFFANNKATQTYTALTLTAWDLVIYAKL